MLSSKMLHRLATRPADMSKFKATGELPRTWAPEGPLVRLLQQMSPRDLGNMRGVTIDANLGYSSSRRFNYGSQALAWVAPPGEHFFAGPAESWRIKRFSKDLYLEDLLQQCTSFPDTLLAKYPWLRRPAAIATR
jgi:hypothetical protein